MEVSITCVGSLTICETSIIVCNIKNFWSWLSLFVYFAEVKTATFYPVALCKRAMFNLSPFWMIFLCRSLRLLGTYEPCRHIQKTHIYCINMCEENVDARDS